MPPATCIGLLNVSVGSERVKYAYAYHDLLKATGILAFGTDFPVEGISPIGNIYAAVERKDNKVPPGRFPVGKQSVT
jgi:predicted amidohydrolase YtcJ